MTDIVYLCDTCCNETQTCIEKRKRFHVTKAKLCSDYLIKESAKTCVRCTKKNSSSSSLFFCPTCKTHFQTLAYIEGDQIGKYGVYCRGHYWNGERMMTTTFSLQTMKAFQSDSYQIPKTNLPIKRKKYPGELTEDKFYRELYTLECEDRTFLASMAEYASRHNEPLF